jgi:hypothetical protein
VRACTHTHTTLLLGAFSPYLAFLRSNIDYDFTIEFAQPVIGRTTWLALETTRRLKRFGTIFFSRSRKFLNRLVRQINRIVVVVANCKRHEKPVAATVTHTARRIPTTMSVESGNGAAAPNLKMEGRCSSAARHFVHDARVRHCPRTPPPTDEDVHALLRLVTICV